MALEDDDLVSIDALTPGKIANNSGTVPAQLGVNMTRGEMDPVYNLPYQYTQDYHFYTTNIATISAGGVTWKQTFQDALQRVLFDIEIVATDSNSPWVAATLAGFEITTTGFDKCVLYRPVQEGLNGASDIYGLTIASNIQLSGGFSMGEQYRITADGKIVFPVKILFISSTALQPGETARELSINLKLTTKNYGSYLPSGFVRVNPMPTDLDIAMLQEASV